MKPRLFWMGLLAFAFTGGLMAWLTPSAQGGGSHAPKAIRYVSPTGSDLSNCTSTPCLTIGYAISQSVYGDQINVASGWYTEHITMTNGVSIYGAGWDQTIINGASLSSRSTVYFPIGIDATTVLSGVQVTGGGSGNPNTSANGGGIQMNGASPRIINTWVVGNTGYWGGGVSVLGGSPTFTNVPAWWNSAVDGGGFSIRENAVVTITSDLIGTDGWILTNSSATHGGGISALTSTVTLSGLQVWGNYVTSTTSMAYGGGLYFQNSKGSMQNSSIWLNTASSIFGSNGGAFGTGMQTFLMFDGNWFEGNHADNWGGGLRLENNTGALINANVFVTNTAYYGGGVSTQTTNPMTFTNNIVVRNGSVDWGGGFSIIHTQLDPPTRLVNNTVADNQGDGIFLNYASGIVIYNNIVFQNSGIGIFDYGNNNTLDSDYNDVYMNSNDGNAGTHGLYVVPQFVGAGDMRAYYHLKTTSPVAKTGLLSIAPPFDIDGDPRVLYASMGVDQIGYNKLYLPLIKK